MGNWNPKYFEKKSGSLEEAILNAVNGVKSQINEASVTTDLDDDPKLFKQIEMMGVKVKMMGKPKDGYVEVQLSGPQAKIDAANKKLNLLPENYNINEKVTEYIELEFKDKQAAINAYKTINNKVYPGGMQPFEDINQEGNSIQLDKVDDAKKVLADFKKVGRLQFTIAVSEKMDAVGKEDGDIDNDGDKDASDKYLAKRRKTIAKAMKKEEKDDFKTHMMYDPKTGKGYEAKTMEDHLRMKKMGYDHKKPNMEAYEMGTKEYADHTKKITPGQFESQGESDWNETVSLIQKKQTSMREALAKVWGFDEGKNPFEKNIDEKKEMGFKVEFGKGDDAGMAVYRDKKDAEAFAKRQPKPIKITKGMYDRFDEEDKTMTGKPATKVSVDPDVKKD